jgi:hypothetical protein
VKQQRNFQSPTNTSLVLHGLLALLIEFSCLVAHVSLPLSPIFLQKQVMAWQARGEDRDKRIEDWAADVSRSFDSVKLRFGDLFEELKARKFEEQDAGRGSCDKDTMSLLNALRARITKLEVA